MFSNHSKKIFAQLPPAVLVFCYKSSICIYSSNTNSRLVLGY